MSETFDLVGKKKKVVDADAYMQAPRSSEDPNVLAEGLSNVVFGGDYFDSSSPIAGTQGDVDRVRVALGKNWDFREKNNKKEFSNNWSAPELFYNKPITIDYCDPSPTVFDGNVELAPYLAGLGTGLSEDIVLNCSVNYIEHDAATAQQAPNNWLLYAKIGLGQNNPTGKVLRPLVRTNHYFFDHYHETSMPFTPEEALIKQPAGKAFFADYNTYYNERVESSAYEESLQENLAVHRSMPTIYGFLRLLSNQEYASSEHFDFSILNETGGSISTLIEENPLEELISIYGFVGQSNPEIFAKIINSNFKKQDGDALFEEYFNTWTSNSVRLKQGVFRNPLEKKFNNLVFSPKTLKSTDLMEKYKNYFPFYCELNFTAKLLTSVGDSMKDLFMTEFMSNYISSIEIPLLYDAQGTVEAQNPPNPHGSWGGNRRFVEYSEETIYENLISSGDYAGSPELTMGSLSPLQAKKSIDMGFMTSNGPYSNFDPIGDDPETVVQKYVAYIRDDFSEPVDIGSPDNTIWRKIFGEAFKLKLHDIYKNNRRTFKEIMDGKPAYTEDIFYKIRKSVKPAGSDTFRVIQTILVPNTSELDLVKFIDTQLKYETAATYKYDVFAMRVVFGSKYRYMWINEFGNYENVPQTDQLPPGSVVNPSGADPQNLVGVTSDTVYENVGGTGAGPTFSFPKSIDVSANLKVEVEPSIRLIEDKIFSTPEIFIMDKPPVTPDINIIPYRAVNNRVKMLITANVDSYRDTPIVILDGDKEKFDKVKAAQISYDGKVEFGSDNPTTRFQIFRTQMRPTKYTDFELYQDINNTVYEESILPNTKYYYTFRAVDAHNHLSNPTPVYEVELIDEKGAVKPIIRTISMEQKEDKTIVKEAQKYIYIKPSQQQLFFSSDPDVDSVFSSETKKKKYKMRLISKGSGKKIDVNFSFRKKTQFET